MKNSFYKLTLLIGLLSAVQVVSAQITPVFLGRHKTGLFDKGAAEIVAYSPKYKKMFVTNGATNSLRMVDISTPSNPTLIDTISLKGYGSDLTSVAAYGEFVAITVIDSTGKLANGKVVFFNASNGAYLSQVRVGANPDMLTFTKDGKKVLVANEGEPLNYQVDPEGSVSIIDISGGVASLTNANVKTAGFTAFNNVAIDKKIKITGKIVNAKDSILRSSTVAEDLEPEYITVSEDNKTAWVTCQENNCLAVLNIDSSKITQLLPLGFKNHNILGQGLDPSNNGTTVAIDTIKVFGMYQPDAIASYKVGSTTYLVTANEGDVRADWGTANNEETDLRASTYKLDTAKFGGATAVALLKSTNARGRLKVTSKYGDFNNDGKFDSAFSFGGRSFSIWNGSTGALVYDSKDEFEKITAAKYPSFFNASSTNNTKKNRSDDKGPEPEAITIGTILDSTYAFIGLERIGGVMIYNITDPATPRYVNYINTRNFLKTPSQANIDSVGELAPEAIVFVPRSESPNGQDLLLVSNEVSGTVSIIQLNGRSAFQMQILHSGDMESNLSAVKDAPRYASIVDYFEDKHVNNLTISSGDNILPGPFMSSGEDTKAQVALRSTASNYYSGTTSALRASVGRVDIAIMNIIGFNVSALGNHEFDLGTSELNAQIGVDIRSSGSDKRWIGAQFPFVSANLDFSSDANLSYLFRDSILRDIDFKTPSNITNNNQKRGIAPSIIIERNGEKIGVVGATTQILANISSPGATTIKGVKVDSMQALAAILQPVIDSLISKKGVNKIIVLSHLQQLKFEKALAPLLKNVDIIIAGGNHAVTADANDRLIDGNVATESYPIVTTNANGDPLAILNNASEWKYVGRFVCDFDANGKLITSVLDNKVNGVYASDSTTITGLYGTYNAGFAAGSKGALVKVLCDSVNSVIKAKDGLLFGKSNVFLEGRRTAVRTEETNFGNLSAQANLAMAKKANANVMVSIKNGGGIRSAIGEVYAVGDDVTLLPSAPNTAAGKARGDISQLDIESSLRFNNRLSVVDLTAKNFKKILEHGVNATAPGVTPGQFPQVAGVKFSFDRTKAAGSKVRNAAIIDSVGNILDVLVYNGAIIGDTNRVIKVVTLNFLAGGGDSYPFNTLSTGRIDLDTLTAIKNATSTANFTVAGSEQDAFAEFMKERYSTNAYNVRDTSVNADLRIQQIGLRTDNIFTAHPKHKAMSAVDTVVSCTVTKLTTKNAKLYNSRVWNTGDTTLFINVTKSGYYWIKESNALYCKVDTVYVKLVNDVAPLVVNAPLCNVKVNDTLRIVNYIGTGYIFYDKFKVKADTAKFFVKAGAKSLAWSGFISTTMEPNVKCPIRVNVLPGIVYPYIVGNNTDTISATKTAIRPYFKDKNYTKYLWSNGDTTEISNLSLSGKYWFKRTNPFGCSQTDTFHFSRLNLIVPGIVKTVQGRKVVVKVKDSLNTNSFVVWSNGDTAWSTVYTFNKLNDTIRCTQFDKYKSVMKSSVVIAAAPKGSLTPTQLSQGENAFTLSVYPIPASTVLNTNILDYTLSTESAEPIAFVITNHLGQTVKTGTVSEQINIENLSEGIYFLKANNQVIKFVKE